jgi:hypothetical protein
MMEAGGRMPHPPFKAMTPNAARERRQRGILRSSACGLSTVDLPRHALASRGPGATRSHGPAAQEDPRAPLQLDHGNA